MSGHGSVPPVLGQGTLGACRARGRLERTRAVWAEGGQIARGMGNTWPVWERFASGRARRRKVGRRPAVAVRQCRSPREDPSHPVVTPPYGMDRAMCKNRSRGARSLSRIPTAWHTLDRGLNLYAPHRAFPNMQAGPIGSRFPAAIPRRTAGPRDVVGFGPGVVSAPGYHPARESGRRTTRIRDAGGTSLLNIMSIIGARR